MAHAVGKAFELVQTLTSGGSPASGLTDADFPSGTVQLRYIDPTGASSPPVALTGGTDFVVEELWALSGTYAFKFTDSAAPATTGIYGVRIEGGGGSVDELIGVLRFSEYDPDAEVLWLNGKNTVGIVSDYDTEGNPTSINVYGFDTAADAENFATNPSAFGSLVRYLVQENYVYDVSTGRPSKYTRRVP